MSELTIDLTLGKELVYPQVSVANGEIYCCIGQTWNEATRSHGGTSYTPHIETHFMKYDQKEDKWTNQTNMNPKRDNSGFLSLNGQLYVIGGAVPHNQQTSYYAARVSVDVVERYDVSSGKWQDIPHLTQDLYPYCPPSVAIYKHCIIVASHTTLNNEDRTLVLLFDTRKNVWHSFITKYVGNHIPCVFVPDADDSIYLITFKKVQSKFSKSRNWTTCPTVYKCKCDVVSNPSKPTFSIGETVNQKCIPETKMQVFRIGSTVYIKVASIVYKTSVRISDTQTEDADVSSYSCLADIDSNKYAVTYCSLDRKYIK